MFFPHSLTSHTASLPTQPWAVAFLVPVTQERASSQEGHIALCVSKCVGCAVCLVSLLCTENVFPGRKGNFFLTCCVLRLPVKKAHSQLFSSFISRLKAATCEISILLHRRVNAHTFKPEVPRAIQLVVCTEPWPGGPGFSLSFS